MANLPDILYQDRIANEVGDTTVHAIAAAMEGVIWPAYADKGLIDKELQYLYAKRTAIDYRLTELSMRVQTAVAGSLSHYYQQQFDHFTTLRTQTQTEIQRIEQRAVAVSGAAVVTMTTARPAPPVTAPWTATTPPIPGDPSPYLPPYYYGGSDGAYGDESGATHP